MRCSSSSMRRILKATWSPTFRTSFGCSTRFSLISEIWISPSSSPGTSNRAKAPKFVRRVISPSTSWPTLRWETWLVQGSSCSCRIERPMRLRSRSMLITLTLTSSPTLSTSLGLSMWSYVISEICTKPSAPPILTKTPKSAMLVIRPVRTSPSSRLSITLSRIISRVSPLAARSLKIKRWRSLSTSMTQHSIFSPTIDLYFSSGVLPVISSLRLNESCEAGIKPRMVLKGTIRPPLL